MFAFADAREYSYSQVPYLEQEEETSLLFMFVVPVTDITSSTDVEVVRTLPEADNTKGIAEKELKVG